MFFFPGRNVRARAQFKTFKTLKTKKGAPSASFFVGRTLVVEAMPSLIRSLMSQFCKPMFLGSDDLQIEQRTRRDEVRKPMTMPNGAEWLSQQSRFSLHAFSSNTCRCNRMQNSEMKLVKDQFAYAVMNRDLRLRRALEIIAQNREGNMWVKLLKPTLADQSGGVNIQWITLRKESMQEGADPATLPHKRQDTRVDDDHYSDSGFNEDLCAVCLMHEADCELRPCNHARFCRNCVVETVCSWRQEGPPRCALCRAPFRMIAFFD